MPGVLGSLVANEWIVTSLPKHSTALNFLAEYHYAGGGSNTSTYRHGLYQTTWLPLVGELMGVALWMPPMRTTAEALVGKDDWLGVLSLSRLALVPGCPTNSASFLLGRSMRLVNRKRWPVLLTYADTRLGHSGVIYKATNWRCDGEVPAGDVWLDDKGRQTGRKRGNRTWTRDEMEKAEYTQAQQVPKIRFVHDVRRRTPKNST